MARKVYAIGPWEEKLIEALEGKGRGASGISKGKEYVTPRAACSTAWVRERNRLVNIGSEKKHLKMKPA